MEKVWAKAAGNFESIDQNGNVYGNPAEAFAFILGAPVETVQIMQNYYGGQGG